MTEAEFEDCLNRYGSELSAWPPRLHTSANVFAGTAAGQQRIAAHQELETALEEALPAFEPVGLATRITALVNDDAGSNTHARSADTPKLLEWLTGQFWRPATVALLPLMLGYGVALLAPGELADSTELLDGVVDSVQLAGLSSDYLDIVIDADVLDEMNAFSNAEDTNNER